ncbi:laccase domain-containing protein [Jannaschia sp. R86511]|uniref:laccase domain-containing protein n=1 Tax=Jannaschia sp. R86511 TaxID=3093853 RepID=UPI0036D2F826
MRLPVAGGGGATPLRLDRTVGRVRFALTGGYDLAVGAQASGGREAVATALGVPVAALRLPRQVHADRVVAADGPWPDGGPEADGVVMSAPGLVAGVLAADCMPLLLGDPDRGLAAAVHVGRRGLHLGIAGVAVAALAAAGARRLLALPGPTVCGRCYEVPEPMRDEVAAAVPAAASATPRGTAALDIPAGVGDQLMRAGRAHGVDVEVDTSWAACTVEDPAWFSHRRDAPTGRHAGLVAVAP